MMRLFQFIGWWWSRLDGFEKFVTVFLSAIVIGIVSIAIFGKIGLLVLLIAVLITCIAPVLMWTYDTSKKMWHQFEREYPPEDVRIMRRLRDEE